jgi:hypothetical protein
MLARRFRIRRMEEFVENDWAEFADFEISRVPAGETS